MELGFWELIVRLCPFWQGGGCSRGIKVLCGRSSGGKRVQTIIKDGIYIDLFFEFQPFCLCFVCGPRFLLVEFYPEEFTKPQSRDKHRGMDERLSEWLSRIRVRDRILLKLIPLAYSFNILTSTPTLLNTIFRLQNLHIL